MERVNCVSFLLGVVFVDDRWKALLIRLQRSYFCILRELLISSTLLADTQLLCKLCGCEETRLLYLLIIIFFNFVYSALIRCSFCSPFGW